MTASLAVETISGGEVWAFWILGLLAVIGALGMVIARNAVHSALFLAALHTAAFCSLGFIVVAIVLMSFLPRDAEAVAWTANAVHAADTVHSVPEKRQSAFADDGRRRQVLSWQHPGDS